MAQTDKYGRTYHFPFSPGATKDDRINQFWWEDCQNIKTLRLTEKLDGENTCLSRDGVYARSHAAPTTSPWSSWIRQTWDIKKYDLPENLEIFGENLEGIHSIEYKSLPCPFFVFAVRDNDRGMWLDWTEVEWFSFYFGFPTVPVLEIIDVEGLTPEVLEEKILGYSKQSSKFDSYDPIAGKPCTMEGLVVRNDGEFSTEAFKNNVFKYVRPHHVQTDEHWTKNWRKASWKFQ